MSIIAKIDGHGADALLHEGKPGTVSLRYHATERVTSIVSYIQEESPHFGEHVVLNFRHEGERLAVFLAPHQAKELLDALDTALAQYEREIPPAPLAAAH